jgi:hypothetical protein
MVSNLNDQRYVPRTNYPTSWLSDKSETFIFLYLGTQTESVIESTHEMIPHLIRLCLACNTCVQGHDRKVTVPTIHKKSKHP